MSGPAGRTGLPLADVAALLTIGAIWGANNVLAKIAVDAVPPLFVLTVRFAIVVAAVGWALKPPGPNRRMVLAVCILTGPLHFGVQYVGLSLAHDLSPMIVAMQMWIPFSVLFAALAMGERPSAARIAGMAVSFAGIATLAIEPSVTAQLGAFALVALAGAFYAGASVLMARTGGLSPLQTQGWVAVVALPFLAIGSAATETGRIEALVAAGPLVWFALVFAALAAGLVANAWMWRLLQRHGVSSVTPWLQISPVIAIGLSIAVLDDPVTPQLFVGLGLALAGVALTAIANRAAR